MASPLPQRQRPTNSSVCIRRPGRGRELRPAGEAGSRSASGPVRTVRPSTLTPTHPSLPDCLPNSGESDQVRHYPISLLWRIRSNLVLNGSNMATLVIARLGTNRIQVWIRGARLIQAEAISIDWQHWCYRDVTSGEIMMYLCRSSTHPGWNFFLHFHPIPRKNSICLIIT